MYSKILQKIIIYYFLDVPNSKYFCICFAITIAVS